MMIPITCPCGKQFQASAAHSGGTVRCPECERELKFDGFDETASRETRYGSGTEDEPAPRRRTAQRSGKALASLILGFLAFGCWMFTGIPAVLLGILGLRDINAGRSRVHGHGLAVMGIVLGIVGTLFSSVAIVVALLVPAVQNFRLAADRAVSYQSLKQLSVAMSNYHAEFGCFPPAVVASKDGRQLYSWRVLVLPYLGEATLYQQFHLNEPWDSPHNSTLLPQMPKIFASLEDPQNTNLTHYQVLIGGGALFDENQRLQGPRLADITDGPANTILIAEAADSVPWTKPEDLHYNPAGPLPAFSPSGFHVAFADARVVFIKKGFDERRLRAAITRSGNETLHADEVDLQ